MERSDMHTSMLKDRETREYELTANDRCDRCGAQAYVQVNGMEGSLLFCAHHWNDIMSDGVGYKKMMSFMISVLDERDRLIENKATEESHA
jgi:hypothetical protein